MLTSDVLVDSLAWHPEERDVLLLAATDSELPLVEAVLASLPARARGQVFVEVDAEDDVRELAAPGRVTVTWLLRERGQSLRTSVESWLSEMLPVDLDREHRVYAWISGESHARAITNA